MIEFTYNWHDEECLGVVRWTCPKCKNLNLREVASVNETLECLKCKFEVVIRMRIWMEKKK